MKTYNLLLAGNSWGATSALNSLLRSSTFQISVLTRDKSIETFCAANSIPLVQTWNGHYDLIICAGWVEKVESEFILNNKLLNIHYSLLPAYRGLHSTVWAILNDESLLGFTVHRMNEFFDDGNIVYQYQTKNDMTSTATWYMEHFNNKVEEVLNEIVQGYLAGTIKEVPQNKLLASWVGKRNLNDCKIDFSRTLDYQKAFFRALTSPYPLPFFEVNNNFFEVAKVAFHQSHVISHTGRILNIDNEGVWVSCAGGYLVMQEIIDKKTNEVVPYAKFKTGIFIQ